MFLSALTASEQAWTASQGARIPLPLQILCTPPMAVAPGALVYFRQLAPDAQRAVLTTNPTEAWLVSRLHTGRDQSISLFLTHGPSGLEVANVPMNTGLARSLGLWFTVLRGGLSFLDIVRLRTAYQWPTARSSAPLPQSDIPIATIATLTTPPPHRGPCQRQHPQCPPQAPHQLTSPPPVEKRPAMHRGEQGQD